MSDIVGSACPLARLSSFCSALTGSGSRLSAATDSISALEKASTRPATGIMDNSFFVEEAYNQEPGVVQHILTFEHSTTRRAGPDQHDYELAFTQEWPVFTQAHQFSYSIPFSFLDDGRTKENGLGDISLDYRYQLLMETETRPAIAPRFALILPTGDEAKGLGNDTLGYEFNLPVSKVVSDRWTLHGNAGVNFFPDVRGRDLVSYSLGASAIYAVSRNFNFMLESVANFDEGIDDFGRTERTTSVIISPGVRYAFNHPNDAQTVIGLAVPIGLTADAPDYGVFLYASFEHFFLPAEDHRRRKVRTVSLSALAESDFLDHPGRRSHARPADVFRAPGRLLGRLSGLRHRLSQERNGDAGRDRAARR